MTHNLYLKGEIRINKKTNNTKILKIHVKKSLNLIYSSFTYQMTHNLYLKEEIRICKKTNNTKILKIHVKKSLKYKLLIDFSTYQMTHNHIIYT